MRRSLHPPGSACSRIGAVVYPEASRDIRAESGSSLMETTCLRADDGVDAYAGVSHEDRSSFLGCREVVGECAMSATAVDAGVDSTGANAWAVETHGLTKRFGDNVAVSDVELLVPRAC